MTIRDALILECGNRIDPPLIERVLAAVANPPTEQPVETHGVTCAKIWHNDAISGWEHAEYDDGPYFVDGLKYCGRCHHWLP